VGETRVGRIRPSIQGNDQAGVKHCQERSKEFIQNESDQIAANLLAIARNLEKAA